MVGILIGALIVTIVLASAFFGDDDDMDGFA